MVDKIEFQIVSEKIGEIGLWLFRVIAEQKKATEEIVDGLRELLLLTEKTQKRFQELAGITECWCLKCGEPQQCEHPVESPHKDTLCGVCAS